jgi:hypothetical protein
MKNLFVIMIAVLFFITSVAFAGPFGLEMGMTLDQVENITGQAPELLADDLYTVNPPNKGEGFESYVVQISPEYGIVSITAKSIVIPTERSGVDLHVAFSGLCSFVGKTYGQCEADSLPYNHGDEPNDMMIGLSIKTRNLTAIWNEDNGSTLPDDIESIRIDTEASMVVMDEAYPYFNCYLILTYYSPNHRIVTDEKRAIQYSVF